MGKEKIRQQLLTERKRLDVLCYHRLSRYAQEVLIASDYFQQAERLALYSPIHKEVATDVIFSTAVARGKRVYYPKVIHDELQFREVASLDDLSPGAFSVPEPRAGQIIDFEGLDLIVVPGVGFDLSGHRLGYGRGYYDRYLAQLTNKNISVGLCFEFQLQTSLPAENYDQSIMFLATETRFIPCHKILAGSS